MVQNLTRAICDPEVEDCSIHATPITYPQESASNLYIFATVSLVNALAPMIWYSVSYDYSGENKNNPKRSNYMEINERAPSIRGAVIGASPLVRQRGNRNGNKNGNRGKGGDRYKDDFDAPR